MHTFIVREVYKKNYRYRFNSEAMTVAPEDEFILVLRKERESWQ
jgi:hypothetical protein